MNEIHHKVFIQVPIEKVFHALTTASEWNAWFTTECEIGHEIGASVRFTWRDYGIDHNNITDGGKIIGFNFPNHFGFTWRPGESETSVEFQLESLGGGTIVTLHEYNYSDCPKDLEAFKSSSVGWGEALTLLKFYLEHGVVYGTIPRP